MDAVEARVRCLELAATMLRPSGIPVAEDVVKIATVMYDFVNAQPKAPETVPAATPDKPQRKGAGSPKGADILS